MSWPSLNLSSVFLSFRNFSQESQKQRFSELYSEARNSKNAVRIPVKQTKISKTNSNSLKTLIYRQIDGYAVQCTYVI